MPVFSLTTTAGFTETIVERMSRNFQQKEQSNQFDSICQDQTIDRRVELQNVSA
jgi:hypothetical protein